jgi:predicted enzyme related to lactoylglutathione lyase
LLTEDAAAAVAFYTSLFDWTVEDSPTGSSVVIHQGRPIAGISQIEDRLPDVDESIWLVGVTVEDLEGAVAAARRQGAAIHRDVERVEGYARYAVIEDPQGALVLLLDPERELGGSEGSGSWVWAELWSDDLEGSAAFYADVVGYERGETERPRGAYTVFSSAGEPRAGLVEFESREIEPAWAPYIGVADLAATIVQAGELGGRVLLEPDAELAEGRVALLADPTGAGFFVYELAEDAR